MYCEEEDTEWNEILRNNGILPPKSPPEITDSFAEQNGNVVKPNCYEKLTLSDLEDLEDEVDERILWQYKLKRIKEIKEQQHALHYGRIMEISRADFIKEVTEAPKGCPVICILYCNALPTCKLLLKHMEVLAEKHSTLKFVKITGKSCIENYPDENLPTIFIYKNGNLLSQHVGPMQCGGPNMTLDGVERIFSGSECSPQS